jgi:putative tryptophan/tyrosine transport system substrate-binding protein
MQNDGRTPFRPWLKRAVITSLRRRSVPLGEAMRRRDFIKVTVGSAAAWPLTARAQQTGRVPRIGVLIPFENENDPQVRDLWPAFEQRLAELGWVAGRTVQFDVHFATQNIERIRASAAEIAASGPELIYVWSNPGLAAIKQATQTISVVFVLVSDPVGSGLGCAKGWSREAPVKEFRAFGSLGS